MFAISPVATSSTALSVPPAVLAVSVSDQVSTRANPVAIAAPLSNLGLTNDAPASAPTPAPQAQNADEPATGNASGIAGNIISANGSSSTFLAQLISQGDSENIDTQIALATSFARFAPATQYTNLVGYSIVKYRPSNAGLPSAYASAPAASSSAESQSDAAAAVSAANDYQAYSVTQTRNQSNLASPEPQFAIAG